MGDNGGDRPRKRRFDTMEPVLGGERKQRIDLSGLGGGGGGRGAAGTEGAINPYTLRPYSARYYDILRKRRALPVYQFLDELLGKVKQSQVGAPHVMLPGLWAGRHAFVWRVGSVWWWRVRRVVERRPRSPSSSWRSIRR
jgi:hypothetical protein